MKLALISAALFLLSYIAVNGGLGERPALLVVPVLMAVGSAMAARLVMGGGRKTGKKARTHFEDDIPAPAPPQPPVLQTPKPPGSSGNKARKLF